MGYMDRAYNWVVLQPTIGIYAVWCFSAPKLKYRSLQLWGVRQCQGTCKCTLADGYGQIDLSPLFFLPASCSSPSHVHR